MNETTLAWNIENSENLGVERLLLMYSDLTTVEVFKDELTPYSKI